MFNPGDLYPDLKVAITSGGDVALEVAAAQRTTSRDATQRCHVVVGRWAELRESCRVERSNLYTAQRDIAVAASLLRTEIASRMSR